MNLLSFLLHRCLLVICALSFCLLSHAQDVAFAWGRGISGNGVIWNSSTADAAGNVYTAGYFSGTADFDPGPNTANRTAVGYSDAFISKLDASGNYVWVIQLSGSGGANINDVEVDAQGNIYVIGGGSGGIDFDPGPGVVNPAGSGFVAKYDPDGNLIWVSRATGGMALAIDANDNVYVTGHGVQVSQYANDAYIAKLSSTGALLWKKTVGGKKEDIAWSIAVDHDGNVIAGGSFMSDTLDVDPGPGVFNLTNPLGGFDSWLIKLDPSGNFIWGGAITPEYPYDIKTDAANNIYITGFFGGIADFNPLPGTFNLSTAPGAADTYLCKLNSLGYLEWVQQLAGTSGSFNYAKAMELDAGGNIYISGYIQGTFDMDPGPGTATFTSVPAGGPFVGKFDANGNYVWGKVFGGTAQAQSYGIGVDAAQNVYTTGFFKDTIDLDPGPNTANVYTVPNAQGVFINKLVPFVGGALPLTWLSVTGQLNSNQQAVINWQVSETNVQGYTIEKSIDGKVFRAIGSITTKGDGTHTYIFTEEAALQQTALYRILQTDVDGQSTYSTIVRIAAGKALPTVTVYPVPARQQVTISITDELLHTKALLIDRAGRPVKTIYLNNYQTLLPVGNLANGLYFLQLANGQTMSIMRQE
jgi:hypothetical protein